MIYGPSLWSAYFSGPCWDHVWPSFTSRPARALKFLTLNPSGLRNISTLCLFFGTMSGPCWDHVWPSFPSRPARALKFSTLHLNCLRPISMECLFFRTMSGSCLDHDWPSYTSRPARLMKFLRLSRHGLRTCLWNVYFLGPCQDHVETMFGLALFPNQLRL